MRCAKTIWLAAAAMLQSVPSAADYLPPTLLQLAAGSDLVVLGRIVALDKSTFTLYIEETLVGTAPDSRVRVSRFQDWACSTRWQPYAIGQREIVFLCRSEAGYRINSAGAEGEWPIAGDRVTCAYYHPSPRDSEPGQRSATKSLDLGAEGLWGVCSDRLQAPKTLRWWWAPAAARVPEDH
jgi:hypothetical protein